MPAGNELSENQPELITPEGLNYECTGCGKCCSGWSVPLTEEDYQRLSAIDWGSVNPDFRNKKLFRPLKAQQKVNTPYAYAINANADGQCPFLKNNLCFIHGQFGPKVKPAMCQLFPYSFNETESGVYASVSFVSRGAIFNAGKALSEQKEYLQTKYKEFKYLFRDNRANWSQIKLSTNVPLTWQNYLEIEDNLLLRFKDKSKSLEDRFINGCAYLNSLLSERIGGEAELNSQDRKNETVAVNQDNTGRIVQSLNTIDRFVLTFLYKTYFPAQRNRPQGYGNLIVGSITVLGEALRFFLTENLSFAASVFKKLASPLNQSVSATVAPADHSLRNEVTGIAQQSKLYYASGGFSCDLASQLTNLPWPDNDLEINDMIYRFFYSHVFGKHYFGAGLGQLSLIAGFHHLAILLALIKLHARTLAVRHFDSKVTQMDIVETIVQLEKSLGELKITGFGAAILELLLASPARIARILQFAR